MVCFTKSWGSLLTVAIVLFSTAIEAVPTANPQTDAVEVAKKPGGPSRPPKKCKKPLIRRSWHSMSKKDRLKYIDAIKCTQKKKGITKNMYGIDRFTIFEDFSFEHRKQTPYIHLVGHFLAWHRYLVKTFETTLREKCNYDGAQPYWDFALDYNNFAQSPIWNSVDGFGGNGLPVDLTLPNPNAPNFPGFEYVSGGGCITTGPFKDYLIRLPRRDNPNPEPRCIERAWNIPMFQNWFYRAREHQILSEPTFEKFTQTHFDKLPFSDIYPPGHVETISYHTASHLSIGGTESDGFFSPSDPLFYMLHTNLDRVWRKWQSLNPEVRHEEYGGNDIPPELVPVPRPDPFGFSIKGVNITADFKLGLSGLAPVISISELQDTTSDWLCYDYDTTYVDL